MAAHMNPCPQCGAPLRWIPEAGIWNCDRCGNRVSPGAAPQTPPPGTYPPPMQGAPQQGAPQQGAPQHGAPQHGGAPHPQQHGGPPQGYHPQQGYPPQGYPPQGYGHYPHHAPRKSKGKLVAILAAVAALAAGGIVLAVVLSKKSSGGGGGGFDSAEALAKATTEALAAGDGDKLVSFTPPIDTAIAALDCPEEARAENEKNAKQGLEETRKRFAEIAGKMKGSGATFKSAHTDGIGKTEMKAGDAVGPCKAKVTVTMTGVGVEVDYTNPSDKSKQTHKTTYGMMILDGHYYLMDPGEVPEPLRGGEGTTPTTPETPPPDTPTTPPADLDAAIAEFEQIKSAACSCTDKACAEGEISKLMAATQKYTDAVAQDPVARDRLTAIASAVGQCVSKFDGGQTPPPDTPTTPTEPGKGLPECEAYAQAAERFIKCSKVPKQSQDAVRTAVDTMRQNWGDPSKMSDDMKKSAAETCVTLEKSMKDAAAAMGCK